MFEPFDALRMFIRWQTYRSVAHWHWREDEPPIKRCKAVLVESHRVNGKPRLQHVAFIGSYEPLWFDRRLDPSYRDQKFAEQMSLLERSGFWRRARERLDRLGNRITPDDRRKIEVALALRVPPTTPEDEKVCDREFVESLRGLKELVGRRH
ncbi:hypothetical protein [Bradyrhizobium sp. RT10b]|uniref:hypothetical protein n=1 Tax=unclassified Bradyrhizobium TaxID=2631580 RepID=UPI003390C33C